MSAELDIPSGRIAIVDSGHFLAYEEEGIISEGIKTIYIHFPYGDGDFPVLRIPNGLEILLESCSRWDIIENQIYRGLEDEDPKILELVLKYGSIDSLVNEFFPKGKLTKEGVMKLREEGYTWWEIATDTLNHNEALIKGIERMTGTVGSVIVDNASIMLTDANNAQVRGLQHYDNETNSFEVEPGRYMVYFERAGDDERHYLFKGEQILKIEKTPK